MGTEYMDLDRQWIAAKVAKRRVLALADTLGKLGERSREHFIRQMWERVAARPSLWKELAEHAKRCQEEKTCSK